MSLIKIKVGCSPLTNNLYLYRHGKNPGIALEKRLAGDEILAVTIEYIMREGGQIETFRGGKKYIITVKQL